MSECRVQVVGLKADYLDEPLGLQNANPRLSWRLESTSRNVEQSAYRIWVASSRTKLEAGEGDLWDTGKIFSKKTLGVRYEGRSLTSRQRCWWRVQIWSERDEPSAPSTPSWWEMALLQPGDWTAKWLAVEDSITKADREAGLEWFWGAPSNGNGTRRFRFPVHLPEPAPTCCLYAVVNETFGKIEGVWVDGVAVLNAEAGNSSGRTLQLHSMESGEHLIAVEVQSSGLPSFLSEVARADGLAVFARFELKSGATLRVCIGRNGRTSLARGEECAWYLPVYDDGEWQRVKLAPIENYQPWPVLPAMYLRRSFVLERPVSGARLYATALGAYEAHLNGARVGDALLTPEPAQYAKRVLYQVYDVCELLRIGENVLGFLVGDGWYASFDGRFAWGLPPRRLLAQLELTFADGSRELITTDSGWRLAESPIRVSEVRVGEVYDARLEQPGWDRADFDSSGWQTAEMATVPACRLVAQSCPPIRVVEKIKPVAIVRLGPDVQVVDFGRQFSGWCRIHVRGRAGDRVEVRYAEVLNESGGVQQLWANIGEPKCDVFILKGLSEGESFEPHFTYRGFRYVQVTGSISMLTAAATEGMFVHSDLAITGRIETEPRLPARIWENTLQAQRSNFVGIPTDCPSREQRGWMGDAGAFWDAAAFNMDVCAFSSRQMDNVVDDQDANGSFPMLAPAPPRIAVNFMHASPPGWGDGSIVLPWTVWRRYADVAAVERYWPAMCHYLEFIREHNPDYIWRHKRGCDFGDWLAVGQTHFEPNLTTPRDLIGTAYWAHSAELMAQMAAALGYVEEEKRLRALSQRVGGAFNEAFVARDGTVGNGSQTSYVLALQFDLLSEGVKRLAAERLAEDVRRRGTSLTTGVLGTQFILDVLADNGFAELAYDLLLKTGYPSWGFMIEQGATAIWESWNGTINYDNRVSVVSQNHYALGAVSGFLFRRLAGIDVGEPGFATIVVRPVLDRRIERSTGHYDALVGRISTDWMHHSNGDFSLDLTVPANVSARIHLPAARGARIEESRRDIADCPQLRLVSRSGGEAIVESGSGFYQFVVRHRG